MNNNGPYVCSQYSKLTGPKETICDRLDTEVKSQRCGSACRYNCSAVAFYCCLFFVILDLNFN